MAKVLVIDDDAGTRNLYAAVLATCGHEVTCASDGEEGIRLSSGVRPDLIITDLSMPIKSGFDVISAVRGGDQGVPIVVVSGDCDDNLHRSRALGASAAFAKPVRLAALRNIVSELLVSRPESGCLAVTT